MKKINQKIRPETGLANEISFSPIRISVFAFLATSMLFLAACAKIEVSTIAPYKPAAFNISAIAPPAPVLVQSWYAPGSFNLGTAGYFTVLSQAGVSVTAGAMIKGNVGVGPIASTALTGFDLRKNALDTYSTSDNVPKGFIYAPDYPAPTPVNIEKAIADMQAAYVSNSQLKNAVPIGIEELGGFIYRAGVFKFKAGARISQGKTLSLQGQGKFIFIIGSDLTIADAAQIVLRPGATANNVLWVVGSSATFAGRSNFAGTILAKSAVTLTKGDHITGRVFAGTAVTMSGSHIEAPPVQ